MYLSLMRNSAQRLVWCMSATTLIAISPVVMAQQAPQNAHDLDEIVVVGVTPVPGFKVDKDKIPGNIQTLRSSDLTRNGAASVLGALDQQVSAVNFNDTLADPFQPDVLFRGFEASPVLGTPQGMAVYQNGVRINEAFGDTVNWDLIPDIAIDRIDVLSATSVFGLNALGGAATVTMKNGFTYQGFDATLSGGSFNQRQAQAEYGVNAGPLGAYVAVNTLKEGGWRHYAQDRIKQYYLDLSFHTDTLTADLSYSRGNNRLFGQGPAPAQSLAVSSENVFTGPQNNINNVDMISLNTAYNFTPTLALSSVVYFRNYRQTVANGDNSDYAACDDDVAPGPVVRRRLRADRHRRPEYSRHHQRRRDDHRSERLREHSLANLGRLAAVLQQRKDPRPRQLVRLRRNGRYLDHQLLLRDLARPAGCVFDRAAIAVFRCNTGRR